MNGFDIFLAEMLPIKTLYYATSNNKVLLHYLAKRGNTKVTYFTQLDCVTHNASVRYLPEKKLSSVMCLIASNIC